MKQFEDIKHIYICLGNINTKWRYSLSQNKHKLIRKDALDKFIYGSYLFINTHCLIILSFLYH